MLNLYNDKVQSFGSPKLLTDQERFAIYYHDLFDYPLNFSELIRWKTGKGVVMHGINQEIKNKNGFYFLSKSEAVLYKRLLHKRMSIKKNIIAKKAAKIISYLPQVKMVGLTGSLAMDNAKEESDIDFLIVTKAGTLWLSRILVYGILNIFNFKIRKPNDKNEKDKLCLNMWMDENDILWPKKHQNIYTAHEIAQIVPLVNKSNTYEKMIIKNKWILKFWPNSVKMFELKDQNKSQKKLSFFSSLLIPLELLAFKLQRHHMESKMTRETATSTRAIFHPQDYSQYILKRIP